YNMYQGNIVTFLKQARKQIDIWANKYDLILDNCCKKNEKIKKWLRLLGFKPSEYQNDKFRIYYRGDIKLYYE
ncbi:MAG: hypothetical protein LUB59_04650, partial [Candidatus Gastranaerophilales bacterium]|nr:hypothetical protein [Candidatus Gastranaerophilales bacterium]